MSAFLLVQWKWQPDINFKQKLAARKTKSTMQLGMEISTPKGISHCQPSLVHELSSQGCVNRICLIALSALHYIESSGVVGHIPGLFGDSSLEDVARAKSRRSYGGAGPDHEIIINATTICLDIINATTICSEISEAARTGINEMQNIVSIFFK